jgi:hypothetical protein
VRPATRQNDALNTIAELVRLAEQLIQFLIHRLMYRIHGRSMQVDRGNTLHAGLNI